MTCLQTAAIGMMWWSGVVKKWDGMSLPSGGITCWYSLGVFRLMAKESSKADRRYQRIATPKGVWVAWQDGKQQSVSRVRDLNLGGLFVATTTPMALGSVVTLLMSVPEGEIRSRAVVRNVVPGEGMGVQFSEISAEDAARVQKLVTRLLRAESATSSQNPPANSK
jgi:PilZ domain